MEELGTLAFEDVPDELKGPSEGEECYGVEQGLAYKDAYDEKDDGDDDERDPERVAKAVHGMLMAGCVLRDPLFAGASAKHENG